MAAQSPAGRAIGQRSSRLGIALASCTLGLGLRALPVTTVWWVVESVGRRLPRRIPELTEPAATAALLGREIDSVLGTTVRGVRGRCLKRSLILYGRLRARGLRPRWSIGHSVGAAGGFAAHAWCSLDGQPVAEPAETALRFREMLVRDSR